MKIFLVQDKHKKKNILSSLNITKVLNLNDLAQKLTSAPDIFLIYTDNQLFLEKVCQTIRHYSDPLIYLCPIILITEKEMSNKYRAMVDMIILLEETYETNKILNIIEKLREKIGERIRALNIYSEIPDTNIILKIIRYIYTRGGEIKPIRDAFSAYGLSYPPIENFLAKSDFSVFNIFDLLEDRYFLLGEFFEKVHFCNNCYFAFLNFMEICPNCKSGDLMIENLIHHFPCAYVAPEDDFRKDSSLICPKCSKELKGIGVDFDRPATIYRCNNCGYVTQDPEVKTVCFNCGKESDPEDLILKTIKIYKITALGESVAIYGMESLFYSILKENIDLLSYEQFLIVLKLEIERCKRYKIASSLLAFQFDNVNFLYEKLGSKTQELFKEISVIIRKVIRKSDVITMINENLIIIILPHTSKNNALIVIDRIASMINQLVRYNFKIDLIIKVGVKEISGYNSDALDVLIEDLLKEMKTYDN